VRRTGERLPRLEDVTDVFEERRPAGGRPVPADPHADPRVRDAAEWDLVSRGVRQRVRALEAFLADVYGSGRAFDDGVVPWRLLYASREFRREAAGITPPNGVRCHLSRIDLVRDKRGRFRVLRHDVGGPSGVSAMSGGIENDADGYPSLLLTALRAAAPPGVTDPCVVLLTPGERDTGYAAHALLARLMGVELVEGRDLSCHGNRVYAHNAKGRRPVHVIYRRVGDDRLDPVQFRPESALGCPGLVNAARAGNVTIANAIGNGVADDTLVRNYIPGLIRYYLGEEPILDTVAGPGGEEQEPRSTALRLLAVNDGRDVRVLPGGRIGNGRDVRMLPGGRVGDG
jgi:uncharacterized circularly permuted ATP-grasp superfamily protein